MQMLSGRDDPLDVIADIRAELFRLTDPAYRDLQIRLTPTVDPGRFIGVRTPQLRQLAGQMGKRDDIGVFLKALPHPWFEEDQLHAFILSDQRDPAECLRLVEDFLPFVDNWATCDQMSPRVFGKHRQALLPAIRRWLMSDRTYTVRFGVKMLMAHFLDDDFDATFLEMAAAVRSEEYYVRMMVAWYFATALAKQYEAALPFIEKRRLDPWTHNKTIRKAIESDRIPPERKRYLRGLKVKKTS